MCSNEDDPGQTDLRNVSTSVPPVGLGGGGTNLTKPADTTCRNPNRRSNKPIMEKRRRARINNCLNELKSILLEAMRKDPARHSKLEKADILELTVVHLKELHRTSKSTDDAASRYRAGYLQCISEVERYLSSTTLPAAAAIASLSSSSSPSPSPSPKIDQGGGDMDSQITCRLLTHLSDSLILGSGGGGRSGSLNSNEKTALLTTAPNCNHNNSSSDSVTASSASASAAAILLAMNGNSNIESEINCINNNNNNNYIESFNHNKSHHYNFTIQKSITSTTTAATNATPTSSNCTATNTNTNANTNAPQTLNVSGDPPMISLVPSRLPSGEIAFIVPGFNSANFQEKIGTNTAATAAAGNQFPNVGRLIMQQQQQSTKDDYEYFRPSTAAGHNMLRNSPLPMPPLSSPEMPLELLVSSSSSSTTSASLNGYRDQHRYLRSSSASPSSTSSSNLSSPLSPVIGNYNSGVYQYTTQQHQFTNIQPAHHHHHHQRPYYKQPYQLRQQQRQNQHLYEYDHHQQMMMDEDMNDDNSDEPLALVKVKHGKEFVVDLSCWRPW